MYEYRANVLDVHDGDTVALALELGLHVTLTIKRARLEGLDSPELRTVTPDGRQPGREAREALDDLLARGPVICRTLMDKTEKYGGLLVRLYVDQSDGTRLDVNAEMLRLGFGTRYDGGAKTLDQLTGLPRQEA